MDEFVRAIDPNEKQLNNLFKEVLDGLRDDILEAQLNVDMYAQAIAAASDGKDLYGNLYNAALNIKGSARDRQLKFINAFKERVSKKEDVQLKKEQKEADKNVSNQNAGANISDMNKFLEEMSKNGQIQNINLDLTVDDIMAEDE